MARASPIGKSKNTELEQEIRAKMANLSILYQSIPRVWKGPSFAT